MSRKTSRNLHCVNLRKKLLVILPRQLCGGESVIRWRETDLEGLEQGGVEGEQLKAFEAFEQRGRVDLANDLKHGQQRVAPSQHALHHTVPVRQHQQQIARLPTIPHSVNIICTKRTHS